MVVAALAWGLTAALAPQTSPALARCHTATQLGPRLYAAPPPICTDPKKTYSASIETTKGRIGVVMPPGSAPVTVNNFVVLAANGFYDGLNVWQVADWVVQTGDPRGDGRGGPGYTLPDEPGPEAWIPGSLGMARLPGGVNGSQFFITKSAWPSPGPDATYNRFGTLVLGLDVVAQLTTSDRILKIEVRVSEEPSPAASPVPSPSGTPRGSPSPSARPSG
ncbi:MAG TPA: peptidylprolyl isomerase [Candidatus Acidoferrales bacterium]|nr:peptidylprolyl isomerase [Candidatus Acidoferrales bacterium]